MQSFFGTDGIRTKFGTAPLTTNELIQLGYALGKWAKSKHYSTVLFGFDTRHSATFIENALKVGLLHHSLEIYSGSLMTTPELYYRVHTAKNYHVGIMLTASHNQYYDNGIKIITNEDGKLTDQDEQTIMEFYYTEKVTLIAEEIGQEQHIIHDADTYNNALLSHFPSHVFDGITVILDCAHGAAGKVSPSVFKQLGATVITINNKPNGKNINAHVGSLHPESLQCAVRDHKAHIGFAYDGDGDRLTVVTHAGEIKDGDDCIALLAEHPTYKESKLIIGTVMTNQGLAHHLSLQEKELVRTPVGDKHVMNAMHKHNALLGAEPSGHIMLHDFSGTADALFTSLRLLEYLTISNNWNMKTFTKFNQINCAIPVQTRYDLSQEPFATTIKNYEMQLQGRLLVRYSGTESILRIMVEDENKEHAHFISQELSNKLSTILNKELS